MARLALTLLLCLATNLALADNDENAEQKARLKSLKGDIKALQQSLVSQNEDRSALGKELETRERAMADIATRINRLDSEIQSLQQELTALDQRHQALEKTRQAQQQHIAREINAAFRLGRAEPLKVLLNQENPEQLNLALKYYRYFVAARNAKIASYRATQAELKAVAETIDSRQDSLRDSKTELEQERTALNEEQQQRRHILAEMDKALGTEKARLAKLEGERKQLETLLTRLETAIQNLTSPSKDPFPALRGKLPWPIQGTVRQAYGSARAQNLPWKGWLIAAQEGDPVHAIHQGRVVFADYLRGHGLVLIIDHGNQYLSLYAHNQVLLKDTGEWVQAGDPVARAGKSGGLAESALYFEIRHNGQPQDPRNWLRARS